jgi:hypothetical protein
VYATNELAQTIGKQNWGHDILDFRLCQWGDERRPKLAQGDIFPFLLLK